MPLARRQRTDSPDSLRPRSPLPISRATPPATPPAEQSSHDIFGGLADIEGLPRLSRGLTPGSENVPHPIDPTDADFPPLRAAFPTYGTARPNEVAQAAAAWLSEQQRREIIQSPGGDRALVQQVIDMLPGLSEPAPAGLGFARADVVKIAKSSGAGQTLLALSRQASALMAQPPSGMGLTTTQIVKIACRHGGPRTLEAVGKHGPVLMRLPAQGGMGLDKQQIVKIAGNDGGAQALEAVGKRGPVLMRPPEQGGMGLDKKQIVKIAGNGGAAQALEAVGKHGPVLMRPPEQGGMGLQKDKVAQIAAIRGGSKALEAMVVYGPALRQHQIGNSQITEIASKRGAFATLKFVAEGSWVGRIGKDDMLKEACQTQGSKALQAQLSALTNAD
jgi:TAL effector repeat